MLFKPFLIEKIIREEKSQTRRARKAGDEFKEVPLGEWGIKHKAVIRNGRTTYCQGQFKSIQPGRGKPTVWWRHSLETGIQQAHLTLLKDQIMSPDLNGMSFWDSARKIAGSEWQDYLCSWGFKPLQTKILDIWPEDVRQISKEDARAEGFDSPWEFLQVWMQINDKSRAWEFDPSACDYWINTGNRRELVGWKTVQDIIMSRPADLYSAWAIKFKREG